jgi:N-acetylglucosaminyl-diphospho-decaprenol L-rhamnosyltransferase
MTLGPQGAGPRMGHGPAPDPDCTVVIVNYYSEELLRRCLESLPSSADPLSLEVIVVDNSGTARASGTLDAWPDVRLIEAGGNVGFAHACNLGMAAARGRHLLLLNPDTVAHPGAVATLSRYLDASAEAGAVAARLRNPDGTLQYSCRRFPRPFSIFFGRYALLTRWFPRNPVSSDYLYLEWDHATTRPVDWVSGACLMVRREVFDQVGGLDDGYFLFVEDMDWCRRIRDAGHEVVYVPQADVTHRIGASRGPVPAWVTWERHRSMLRYVRKHFAWPLPVVMLAGLGLVLRAGLAVLEDRFRGGRAAPSPETARRRTLPEGPAEAPVARTGQAAPVPLTARLPPG